MDVLLSDGVSDLILMHAGFADYGDPIDMMTISLSRRD
jgi:hypothetical protein